MPRTEKLPDASPGWVIQSSPKVALIVTLLTIVAILAAWLNGLPLIVRLVLVVTVLAYAGIQLKELLAPRYRRIGVDPSGVVVTDAAGNSVDLTVQGKPFVSPLFIGLAARRRDNRRWTAVGLFRGQLAEDDYRGLAAWLRKEPGH